MNKISRYKLMNEEVIQLNEFALELIPNISNRQLLNEEIVQLNEFVDILIGSLAKMMVTGAAKTVVSGGVTPAIIMGGLGISSFDQIKTILSYVNLSMDIVQKVLEYVTAAVQFGYVISFPLIIAALIIAGAIAISKTEFVSKTWNKIKSWISKSPFNKDSITSKSDFEEKIEDGLEVLDKIKNDKNNSQNRFDENLIRLNEFNYEMLTNITKLISSKVTSGNTKPINKKLIPAKIVNSNIKSDNLSPDQVKVILSYTNNMSSDIANEVLEYLHTTLKFGKKITIPILVAALVAGGALNAQGGVFSDMYNGIKSWWSPDSIEQTTEIKFKQEVENEIFNFDQELEVEVMDINEIQLKQLKSELKPLQIEYEKLTQQMEKYNSDNIPLSKWEKMSSAERSKMGKITEFLKIKKGEISSKIEKIQSKMSDLGDSGFPSRFDETVKRVLQNLV